MRRLKGHGKREGGACLTFLRLLSIVSILCSAAAKARLRLPSAFIRLPAQLQGDEIRLIGLAGLVECLLASALPARVPNPTSGHPPNITGQPRL